MFLLAKITFFLRSTAPRPGPGKNLLQKLFGDSEKKTYFCPSFGGTRRRAPSIDPWCNGNTADFGSVVPGSSPGGSTFFERFFCGFQPDALNLQCLSNLAAGFGGDNDKKDILLTRGVMVTLQILVLSFWVRILAGQHFFRHLPLSGKGAFFFPLGFVNSQPTDPVSMPIGCFAGVSRLNFSPGRPAKRPTYPATKLRW